MSLHAAEQARHENTLANIRDLLGLEDLSILGDLTRLVRIVCLHYLATLCSIHHHYVALNTTRAIMHEGVRLDGVVVKFGGVLRHFY